MVNKLANTQQKLRVLKNSEKHDVLEFLKRDDSRGSKQSKSKSRIGNPKLKNVHSIPAEALLSRQPQMQFVNRSTTFDTWAKRTLPNTSMLNYSIESSGRNLTRQRSRSKNKQTQLAYVSIISSNRSNSVQSRKRSKSKQPRSPSVKSRKSSKSKTKQFKTIRDRLYENQYSSQLSPIEGQQDSVDLLNESSIGMVPYLMNNSIMSATHPDDTILSDQ